MNKEIQKFFDEQWDYLLKNDLIDQDTKYAKHFRKVLEQLA